MAKKRKNTGNLTHKQLDDAIRKSPRGLNDDPSMVAPPGDEQISGGFNFQTAHIDSPNDSPGGSSVDVLTDPGCGCPDPHCQNGERCKIDTESSQDGEIIPESAPEESESDPSSEEGKPGEGDEGVLAESLDQEIARIWREDSEDSEDRDDMAEIRTDCFVHQSQQGMTERPTEEWVPEWYLRTMVRLEAEESKIREQTEIRVHQIRMRAKGLEYRFGEMMKKITRELIKRQGGKRKSVDLAFGRLGFRKTAAKIGDVDCVKLKKWLSESVGDGSITIDEQFAIQHMEKQPDIEKTSKKEIMALVKSKGLEADGVEFIGETEKWYFKV